jgi:DNA-binding NarL/FixJ family response regulator
VVIQSGINKSISVILADDHQMVRQSLARVLETSGSISVLAETGSGSELAELVGRFRPDCLVLDYSIPPDDAPHVIAHLLESFRSLKILVLTVHENAHYAVRALEAGALGYLIKSAAVEELVAAIRAVHAGDVYISRKISQEVWSMIRRPKRDRTGLAALSQREFDVLTMLGTGATLQDCARQMDVSTSTVSTYRTRILEKLNLNSTSELIRFAIEHGLV